jgi:anti-sigma regulatory factor (Ser/Thr protein kinase)
MKPNPGQVAQPNLYPHVATDLNSVTSAIRLTDYVGLSQVEQRLAECSTFSEDTDLAYVDLLEAIEFDVEALVVLLAAVAGRRASGKETKFRLPRDPLARHVLRLWRFPKAATAVTGTPFRILVETGDLKYFGEKWPSLREHGTATNPSGSVLEYLVGQQHFGFSVHRINGEEKLAAMMDNEVSRWRNYALIQLLNRLLPGQAIDVARVVLQELLANVVEHPNPSLVVLASQLALIPHTDEAVPAELTVSIWDDGVSIVDTLRECLQAGGRIRTDYFGSMDTFAIEARSWPPQSVTYSSNWTPTATAQDAEILLASLFPGITRKAASPRDGHDAQNATDDMNLGLGLFTLYKTVLDYFGGTLELRCGQTTLKLDRMESEGNYRAKISAEDKGWNMPGTIITARLPVHDA